MFQDRLAVVQYSLHETKNFMEVMERDLARIQTPIKEREQLIETIKEKENELATLKATVESQKAGLKEQDESNGTEPLDVLRKRLAELNKMVDELKTTKEAAHNNYSRQITTTNKVRDAGFGRIRKDENLDPIQVALVGKQVVPIELDYYFRYNQVSETISRVKDGDPVDVALAKGGCFAKLLVNKKPSGYYIKFWVCPDAVPTFRQITEAVRKKGYSINWVPGDDGPIHVGTHDSHEVIR